MTASGAEQREVYYSGRVHGVGFRYTVRSLASRLAVSGFVKNLPDGRVHLVVEGPPGEIDGAFAANPPGNGPVRRRRGGADPSGHRPLQDLRGPLLSGRDA